MGRPVLGLLLLAGAVSGCLDPAPPPAWVRSLHADARLQTEDLASLDRPEVSRAYQADLKRLEQLGVKADPAIPLRTRALFADAAIRAAGFEGRWPIYTGVGRTDAELEDRFRQLGSMAHRLKVRHLERRGEGWRIELGDPIQPYFRSKRIEVPVWPWSVEARLAREANALSDQYDVLALRLGTELPPHYIASELRRLERLDTSPLSIARVQAVLAHLPAEARFVLEMTRTMQVELRLQAPLPADLAESLARELQGRWQDPATLELIWKSPDPGPQAAHP